MKRVLRELLAHHLPRCSLREAESDPELDAGLERVALGRAFVVDAAEVPGLVREDGNRSRSLARRRLVLVCEPVEVVAALRGQIGAVAADQRNAVCVLDEADVVPRLVATDRRPPCPQFVKPRRRSEPRRRSACRRRDRPIPYDSRRTRERLRARR